MATGDILSATVDTNGWWLLLVIEGLNTGGTYSPGWTSSDNPRVLITPKIKLTVTSLGFIGGTATTVSRDVFVSIPQRLAFPNEASLDETFASGNVTLKLRLSNKIYAKDKSGAGNSGTDIVGYIQSGFYTQGGTPNNARSGFTVTNNSTSAYPKTVANWSMVAGQLMQGSTFRLKACAFSKHFPTGDPTDCVEFSLTDGTNTVTRRVYQARIDQSSPDRVPVIEYFADMPLSTLNQGAVCTAHFKAWPRIGDTAAIRDTSVGGTTWPTALYGPTPYVCDKNGTYGQSVAVVDPSTGNDSTGVAADISNLSTANASPFLTLAKAAVAITTRNNSQYSRNNCGGGIVYMKAGNHTWLGAANTGIGGTPDTWITFAPYPGTARSAVTITAQGTTGTLSGRVKLDNLTITVATSNTFTNIAAIWLNNIDLNTTGTIFNTTNGYQWMTFGKVTNSAGQGLRHNSSTGSPFAMVRGVDLPSFNKTINGYMVIGNDKYNRVTPASTLVSTSLASVNAPVPDTNGNWIIAFNKFRGLETPAVMFECGVSLPCASGAIVQNLFETCGTQPNGLGDIGASDGTTTNTPHTNIIVAHNTCVGNRVFVGYNEVGTLIKEKLDWIILNNYWDRTGYKTDPHNPGSSNRTGNWEIMSGVDTEGDYKCQNMISGASFYPEFNGIKSYNPSAGNTGTAAEAQFVDRKSATEILGTLTAGAGNGDYRIPPTSPICRRTVRNMLRWDIEGKARCAEDAAGAYSLRRGTIGRSLA